jgi:hypothetical protein
MPDTVFDGLALFRVQLIEIGHGPLEAKGGGREAIAYRLFLFCSQRV